MVISRLSDCSRLLWTIPEPLILELPTYDIDKLRNYCCLDANEDSSLALFLKKMAVFVSVYQ